VVERPASVVKELVENALDAGARQIRVELDGGGVGLIRVRDDGHGIPPDELLLALGRHCTSKLREFADLDAIASLGFRGEALPSIASVSRLSIASSTGLDSGAFAVWQEGVSGPPGGPQRVAHPPGTTVEVRDLFYNVPARRRFLKAEATEFDHIDQFLRRLALSRPGVAFRLEHPGRRGFSVAAARSAEAEAARVAVLLGRPFARAMRPVAAAVAELRLGGWIAPPEVYAPAHLGLAVWTVNGRVVRDPALARAARMACGEALPAGRHPAYCLHLELDPCALDVNVHPMKLEVRYRDARRVLDFVLSSLREVLGGVASRGPAATEGLLTRYAPVATGREEGEGTPLPVHEPAALRPAVVLPRGPAATGEAGWVAGGRAWLLPAAGGLHLLDPARWLADRAWRALADGTAPGRRLLLPARVPVDAEGRAAVEAARTLLAGLGLELQWQPGAGGTSLLLMSLPEVLAPLEPGPLLAALVAHAREETSHGRRDWARWLCDRLLAAWPGLADSPALAALAWPSAPLPADAPAAAPASPYRPYWHWVALGEPGGRSR
jgi:DNA mismatch repair protein MutL